MSGTKERVGDEKLIIISMTVSVCISSLIFICICSIIQTVHGSECDIQIR